MMLTLNAPLGDLAAIVVVVLVGFLPNELWRVLGVVFGRRIDEDSALMRWVKTVATALVAAVIARLVLVPSGALVALPLGLRLFAVASGIGGFYAMRRSVLAGVLTAEVVLATGAWWLGVPG